MKIIKITLTITIIIAIKVSNHAKRMLAFLNNYVNETNVIDLITRLNNLVTDGEYTIIRNKKIK